MVHRDTQFGFAAASGDRFRLHGRRYWVGSSGVTTLELLSEICHARSTRAGGPWLLRFRNQIRQVQTLNRSSVLSLVIERTDDPALRILAIWLRGRCGGTLGTKSVVKFASQPDEQTRKEVARALKRMSAWVPLRKMADGDASERIRRMATVQPPRPYRDRLADFSRQILRREVTPVKRHLLVAPEVDLGQGRPPKSPSYMRMILERIHRMVAGHPR